jgi:predicted Rdx family selenoprotein
MAESLITTFRPPVGQPHPIEDLLLIPSGNGRFEIIVDGDLIYSKAATGKHTDNETIAEMLRQRMTSAGRSVGNE